MITLAPLSSTRQNELSYESGDEQMQFTVLPKDWLDDERADAYRMVILDDDLHQVVGFFVVDIGQQKYRCTEIPMLSYFAPCPEILLFKVRATLKEP